MLIIVDDFSSKAFESKDLAEVFLCSWWEVLTESMEFNSEFGLPVTDSKSLLIISNNLYGHLVMESGKAFIIDVNK